MLNDPIQGRWKDLSRVVGKLTSIRLGASGDSVDTENMQQDLYEGLILRRVWVLGGLIEEVDGLLVVVLLVVPQQREERPHHHFKVVNGEVGIRRRLGRRRLLRYRDGRRDCCSGVAGGKACIRGIWWGYKCGYARREA